MRSRERGSLWPIVSVAAGSFFVLVVVPLVMQREHSNRMATVEAQVNIGDTASDSSTSGNARVYHWPDSEVPRTAERLRDVTAVSVAATTFVVEGAMTGHPPRDANEILSGIANRRLVPNEWLTSEPGVLKMPHGTAHLRYSPNTLTVEVVSVPNELSDGPAILIRIPDLENSGVGPRYFESMQLDGLVYPAPFAPIQEIIASGWQPRLFKQTQMTPFTDDQRAQLEQWAKNAIRK
jgi:hypothetical protein